MMGEDSAQHAKTPNEQLAQIIVDELIEGGLLKECRKRDVLAKIQTGKASQSDWRRWTEETLPQEGAENASS